MKAEGQFRTFDSGAVRDTAEKKPMIHLISPFFLQDLGEWLRFACQDRKPEPYPPRNWEAGMPFSETLGSGLRHLVAMMAGDESEDHAAAVGFAAMAIAHYRHEIAAGRLSPSLDDLPHYPTQPQVWDGTKDIKRKIGTEILLKGESDRFLHQLGRPTFYVAGPMRGIPQYNFPAFDDTTKRARARGWLVISPSDLDRGQGLDPVNDPEGVAKAIADPKIFQGICKRDCNAILALDKTRGDGMILLSGWPKSTGARAEVALALWMGLKFRRASDFVVIRNGIIANLLFYQKDGARG